MRRLKVVMAVAAVLTFGAGAVVGMGHARNSNPPRPESRLSEELDLTADQERQMRDVWSEVMDGVPQSFDKFRDLQQQFRRDALALLTPDQRAKYDDLEKRCREQLAKLDEDRDARFSQAVARTKKILTPEQAAKYDQLMSRRRGPGGGPPPPGGPGGPRDDMLLMPGPGSHGHPPDHGRDGEPWDRPHAPTPATTNPAAP